MFIGQVLSRIVQYGCVMHCICEYIGGCIIMCVGPSMEPTLYTNDIVIMERISVRLQKLKRGDIIISKCPFGQKSYICKRVVGLPGDIMQQGVIVPCGHLWLEGDNSNNSDDSRQYGPVPQGLVKGRVFCKIFPLKNMTLFVRENTESK